eukprot:UN28828
MFLTLRFLAGIGIGGSMPLVFTYFCEFLPPKERGVWLVYLAFSWIFGSFWTGFSAWIIMGYLDRPWNVFLLVCAVPVITACILLFWCDPSPKFLLTQGKSEESLIILKKIAKINGKEHELLSVNNLTARRFSVAAGYQ